MNTQTRTASKESVYKGKEIWNDTLKYLRQEYGGAVYNSWFSNLQFHSVDDDILTVTAPTKFIREWILTNYFRKIRNYVEDLDQGINKINLKVQKEIEPKNDNMPKEFRSSSIKNRNLHSQLDKKSSFANFMVGESNKIAHTAAKKFISFTAEQELPSKILYLYGEVGMGKTHLLQAMAQEIKKQFPGKKVAYLSAEKFMHLYVLSVRNNELSYFKEKLRDLDIILMDDVQFLCGKSSTQKEFSNTIDALIEGNKRIVVSADKSPYNLDLNLRSKSRLTSGIVVDIKPAEYSLRAKILKHYAQSMPQEISSHIIEFIASNITNNVRELVASLYKLTTHASLTGTELNMQSAQAILQDCMQASTENVSMTRIIEVVADFYNIDREGIISKSRATKYVHPRQIVALIAKNLTDLSLQDIGKGLGNRDHSTVIYYIKKLQSKLEGDNTLARNFESLMQIMRQA